MISTKRMLLAVMSSVPFSAWTMKGSLAASTHRFTNMIELRKAVIEIFRRTSNVSSARPDASDPAKITLDAGGHAYTVDLTNLFDQMSAYPDKDPDKLIAEFTAAIGNLPRSMPSEENLVVVFRDKGYLDHIRKIGPLTEPFIGELAMVYMADMPETMSPVSSKEFPGKDAGQLRGIALNNVRKWLGHVKSDNDLKIATLYFVDGNPLLSPTLILLDEFWASISDRHPGDVLIVLPRRDQLFIFDDNAEGRAVARRLIDVTFRDGFSLLSNRIFARRNGRIVEA